MAWRRKSTSKSAMSKRWRQNIPKVADDLRAFQKNSGD
jgi:hypothetical protein